MSNNTARLAREWAQFELDNAGEFSDKGRIAAAEHILATTTEPTMADVDWDTKKHRGAGATDTNGKLWVMSEYAGGYINCTGLDMDTCGAPADTLTPNGKRYELREVGAPEQPAHPETLETQADYENAPEGTIVAYAGCSPYLKKGPDKWEDTHYEVRGNEGMSGVSRQMLRRGWGE